MTFAYPYTKRFDDESDHMKKFLATTIFYYGPLKKAEYGVSQAWTCKSGRLEKEDSVSPGERRTCVPCFPWQNAAGFTETSHVTWHGPPNRPNPAGTRRRHAEFGACGPRSWFSAFPRPRDELSWAVTSSSQQEARGSKQPRACCLPRGMRFDMCNWAWKVTSDWIESNYLLILFLFTLYTRSVWISNGWSI
jgi:hypothetical protein